MRNGSVVIDSYHGGSLPYGGDHTVVAIDVIRATTTCATAVTLGRRCFPVASVAELEAVAARLGNALVAGEIGGDQLDEFELQNSPVALLGRHDTERPLVLLSTSGTRLLRASAAETTHVACLRNRSATVRALLRRRPEQVALVGAGSRGEFREEDQICAAWIAAELLDAGYGPADAATEKLVEGWRGASLDSINAGNSAAYLRSTGQLDDLEFVLAHDDDLDDVLVMWAGEVARVSLNGA